MADMAKSYWETKTLFWYLGVDRQGDDLVRLSENRNLLCWVASHEAFLSALWLLKRVAPDGGAGLFFHLQFISIAEVEHR